MLGVAISGIVEVESRARCHPRTPSRPRILATVPSQDIGASRNVKRQERPKVDPGVTPRSAFFLVFRKPGTPDFAKHPLWVVREIDWSRHCWALFVRPQLVSNLSAKIFHNNRSAESCEFSASSPPRPVTVPPGLLIHIRPALERVIGTRLANRSAPKLSAAGQPAGDGELVTVWTRTQ